MSLIQIQQNYQITQYDFVYRSFPPFHSIIDKPVFNINGYVPY